MQIPVPILAFTCAALLAGCSSAGNKWVPWHPYRIDVRQGNFVTQEMAAQLKPGMTRKQVRFVLGTPLIEDIFHADRWDYAYRLSKGNDEIVERRLTVYFDKDVLTKVTGDVVAESGKAAPEPANAVRTIDIGAPAGKAAKP